MVAHTEEKPNSYAVSATQGMSQAVFRFELAAVPGSIVDQLRAAVMGGEALCSAGSEEADKGIVIVPGPGMFFQVLGPWQHYKDATAIGRIEDLDALRTAHVKEDNREGEPREMVRKALRAQEGKLLQQAEQRARAGAGQLVRAPGLLRG